MKVFVSIPRASDVLNTFFPDSVKQYMESYFDVVYSPYDRALTEEEFSQAAMDADVVITCWGHVPVTYDLLRGSKVRLVAHTGGSVGYYVDRSLFDNGIRVISGNLLYAESVAEGTIAYMLLGLRKIPDYLNLVRDGGWSRSDLRTEGLLDQTVGIVGLGTISRILISMLQTFRVKTKIYSSHSIDPAFLEANQATQVSLEEVFSTCKVVSIHESMTEKTRSMIGKEHFDLLQDGALFINTARGGIIREDEMIAALQENRFRAVLDVYCMEPLPLDSPLRYLKNVYSVPHHGGPTIDRRPYIAKALIDNINQFSNGQPMELEIDAKAAARMTVGM